MLLSPPRRESILARRLAGLGASAFLHAAVLLGAWSGGAAAPAALEASTPAAAPVEIAVTVTEAVPVDAADGALERRPALELAGVEVDLDKIQGPPERLFPFVVPERLSLAAGATDARGHARLVHPFGARPTAGARPPLELSGAELQALVDRAWSRRERWRPFAPIADLVQAHDGDTGRAADLLRAYSDQNLLQPYYDGDTLDARYWTMLGLAADHERFLALVTAYRRERPRTKAAIELLFLLDELVQGSRDTLLMVVANDPAAALRRSRSEQPAAFARAETLYDGTRAWLAGLGLDTHDAIRRRLDAARLRILETIVEQSPSGYRTADARFLAGVIWFEQRDRARAAAMWARAAPGPEDLYAAAIGDIHAALGLAPERRVAAILAALGAEHGRWVRFSEDRLRRFGYRSERF